MPQLAVPAPFLHLSANDDDDDDESPSDSSRSTPRSSFVLYHDPSAPQYADDLRPRPYSLVSFDSGYFSLMPKGSLSKSCSRKPSGVSLRSPLFHINNATDITHASPKRDGVIKNLLRKKKKSMTPLSPPDLDPFALSLSPDEPIPQLQSAPPPRSKPRDTSVKLFEGQDHFVVRRGMKHHPYSHDDAPYMLAYDRTLLDNDRFSEILLRRLNHNNSPSFHDFTHAPPETILDLGCGPGGWAVEAAEFWSSSLVIGLDLLDPVRLRGGAEAPSNVQWKQGNFVKYKLPFPKNMFDLVRMANLSQCIPQDRWEHVMLEARRVLAKGGRLELIDDYMFFPYTKRSPHPSASSHEISCSRPSSCSFDDNRNREDTSSERLGGDDTDNDDDDFVSTRSRFSSLVEDDFLPQFGYDPVAEWNRNVENSKSLENIFEDMLSLKFSVHPRPSKFIESVIDTVFGRYNQCRLHEFNLYLAPPSGKDSDDSSAGSSETQGSAVFKKAGKDFSKWMTSVDWDHHKDKEKKHRAKGDRSSGDSLPSLSMVPDMINAKAAGRLGIKPASQPTHLHTAQSPGLILWPTTFIPIAPFELEMHACKHLHSLIGSKAALTEYLQDVAREQHLPFEQQMLDDLIWDYESFRRKRFNWPSDCPDSYFEGDAPIPVVTTPRSSTFRSSHELSHRPLAGHGSMTSPPEPLFQREKLDLVRSIRVYGATKLDEEIHVS